SVIPQSNRLARHPRAVDLTPYSDRTMCKTRTLASLFDHLVGEREQLGRNVEAQHLGGLEIDDQLELGRLLDGEVGGLGAFQYLVHVLRSASIDLPAFRSVGHQSAGLD